MGGAADGLHLAKGDGNGKTLGIWGMQCKKPHKWTAEQTAHFLKAAVEVSMEGGVKPDSDDFLTAMDLLRDSDLRLGISDLKSINQKVNVLFRLSRINMSGAVAGRAECWSSCLDKI
ncbi:hypothetical protein ABZP36_003092 [Zizania latifolia]